jgi:hypothetical protein
MNPTCTLLGSNRSLLLFNFIYICCCAACSKCEIFYLVYWTSRGSSRFDVHEETFRNFRSYWNLFLYSFLFFSVLFLVYYFYFYFFAFVCVLCVNMCRTSFLFCNVNSSDPADVSVYTVGVYPFTARLCRCLSTNIATSLFYEKKVSLH